MYSKLGLLVVISLTIRLLLVPAYFSTDYDVHRNWLRITYNYPLQEWYTNDESIWTLDYPPIFAYFQYLLTFPARIFCPQILTNQQLNCHLPSCVLYHRITVILSEFVFLYAVFKVSASNTKRMFLVFLQFGLVLLDDIHFQYNCLMQGIIVLAVHYMMEGRILRAAFIFSWLLNMKHIYLYVAPIFFLYILKHYVFTNGLNCQAVQRLLKVGTVTLAPFIFAFLPFILAGGLQQVTFILQRLFPFQRGLVHSYWAPNFWAIYYFADRILAVILKAPALAGNYSSTLKILPTPSPMQTLLIILVISLPLYIKCLTISTSKSFPKYVILSGLIFCYFGYHVHEKALTVYINLSLLFLGQKYWREALVNSVNLMPLLINVKQKVVKIIMTLLYLTVWGEQHREGWITRLAMFSGAGVVIFHEIVHPFITRKSLEFLPLMLNSVWAACFNTLTVLSLYRQIISIQDAPREGSMSEAEKDLKGQESVPLMKFPA